jgi:apolipoprotein N-acyltransferase
VRQADRTPAYPPAPRPLALVSLAAFIAGAVAVAGFAPFYLWPLPIASLAVLFAMWAREPGRWRAFTAGYAFGLGFFLVGVSWIYVSLHDYGGMPMILTALAVLLFCAYLALFPALAGWLAVRFAANPAWRLVFAAAAFALCEWLRGWLFTGFPWLSIGTSQAPSSPLAGFAPLLGTYGVTLLAAAVAAVLAALALRLGSGMARGIAAIAGLAILGVGAWVDGIEFTTPAGAPIPVALLQGNIPQELKWRDDERARIFSDYRAMIAAAPAKVVVLPETALPAFLDELPPEYLAALREEANAHGKEILLGTVERTSPNTYYNSVVPLVAGHVAAYRKHHLVPFGEFVPDGFKWVMAVLHIPLDDFARGAVNQPALTVGGTAFGVAICYEDLFGEEVIQSLPAAQVLLNVSNDAWFGHSLEPEQHLQGSQMRALETGRWMVRATNTGATAAIDPKGRVATRLPDFTRGTLVANVEPRSGMTPYSQWGNWAAICAAAALALLAAWRARHESP